MRKTWRLQGSGETCYIAPRSLVSQEEQAAYLSAMLDRWLADPLMQKTVLEIYETLRGQSALLARRLRGQELHRSVKSEILEAFRHGELVLMRLPHVTIFPAIEKPREEEAALADEPPPTPEPTRKQKTWVGIELVDQKERPVPGARYILELPDGTKRSGKLDENGRLQVRDIDPGTCKVWFPDIDAREWEGGTEVADDKAPEQTPSVETATTQDSGAAPAQALTDASAPSSNGKSWVELELVDEEGNAVPKARYILCLPDGSERTGILGDDGRGREDGVAPGVCKVTFPDFDAKEWEAS